MSTFIASIVKENDQWSNASLEETKIFEVGDFQEYRIAFSENGSDVFEVKSVDLEPYFEGYDVATLLMDVITDNVDSLPYIAGRTSLANVDALRHYNLYDLEELTITRSNNIYNPGGTVPISSEIDVMITSTAEAYAQFGTANMYKNCIFSVNGLIVPKMLIDDRLYLLGAARSLYTGDSSGISMYDFTELGTVETYGFDFENVKTDTITIEENMEYITRIGIILDVDLTDKFIIPVIAGIPIMDRKRIKRLNQNTVMVELDHAVALRRLMRLNVDDRKRYLMDWQNPNSIKITDFSLKDYMKYGNNFIVTIERDGLCMREQDLYTETFPGQYTFYRYPNGLIQMEDGSLMNYRLNEFRPERLTLSTESKRRWTSLRTKSKGTQYITAATEDKDLTNVQSAKIFDIYALDR